MDHISGENVWNIWVHQGLEGVVQGVLVTRKGGYMVGHEVTIAN